MAKKKKKGSIDYDIHWVDAHCHLCSPPLSDNFAQEIEQAKQTNIKSFVSSALNSREIDWHLNHSAPEILITAGVHPYYDKSDESDIPYLVSLCDDKLLWGIGEVGFDSRKNNHNYQKKILLAQLDIANQYNLPVVFHIVKKYNELYQILKNDFPDIRGYIHGFYGSYQMVEMFSRLDNIGFSIGNKLLRYKEADLTLKEIIRHGKYFFETDAPFQRSDDCVSGDYLTSLIDLVDSVSDLVKVPVMELLDGQWESFQSMSAK